MERLTLKRRQKVALGILVGVILVLFVIPYLIPIPAAAGTVPPSQLADPNSQFVDVNGITVHYKISGSGEPVYILLHGFGASVFSWSGIMDPLGEHGTVIAFDRPAFGLTSRPLSWTWKSDNPYTAEYSADLTIGLMDKLGIQKAILVGHSAGAAVAVEAYLRHPNRVEALVLEDPAIYDSGGAPNWISYVSWIPLVDKMGPLLVRSISSTGVSTIYEAWHDPSKVTQATIDGYKKPLQAENWDTALWYLTAASHPLNLVQQLERINVPVLFMTGDDDRIIPTNQTIQLANSMAGAQLTVVPNCGHIPHEEQPQIFMDELLTFANRLTNV